MPIQVRQIHACQPLESVASGLKPKKTKKRHVGRKCFCRAEYSLYLCLSVCVCLFYKRHRPVIFLNKKQNMNNQQKNRTALCGALLSAALAVSAQSGTNSPYSQYGLGILSDQSQSVSRGMGGVGIGLRAGTYANSLNPASYSAVDSLTMLFDVGVSGQITNFKEGNAKRNANNADFEYAVATFRLRKALGMTVGLLPYTNIGYSYTSSTPIGSSTTSNGTYSGSGGIHQALVGLGWNPLKGFSIGVNASYLWGSYERTVAIASSDTYVNTLTRTYGATVTSYKLDMGVQYEFSLGKADRMVLGAVYGLGHKLGCDPTMTTTITNPQTSTSTPTSLTATDALSIPHSFGVGLTWMRSDALIVGADYTFQKWGNEAYPILLSEDGKSDYVARKGLLSDRHKVAVGAEWTPQRTSRNLLRRIHYRIGASYNTPYIKVNGSDGPKEYGVTAGFGIPMTNSWNNRSVLNISGQWVRTSMSGFITENTFRINLGLTFNERWFMKWKVE